MTDVGDAGLRIWSLASSLPPKKCGEPPGNTSSERWYTSVAEANRTTYWSRSACWHSGQARLYAARSRCIPATVASASFSCAVTLPSASANDARVASRAGRLAPGFVYARFGHVASPVGSSRASRGMGTEIVAVASTDGPDVCFAKWSNGERSATRSGVLWKLLV